MDEFNEAMALQTAPTADLGQGRAPAAQLEQAPSQDPYVANLEKLLGLGKIKPETLEAVRQARMPAETVQPQMPVAQPAPMLASDVVPPVDQRQLAQASMYKDIGQGLASGYKMQQDALVQGAAAGVKQASAEAAYMKEAINQTAELEKQRLEREASRQATLKTQTDKLEALTQEYGNQKVDPNRFYARQDTGSKILTGIGLFLGALTQTGDNPAIKVINDAITRDIEAQKANIDLSGNKVKFAQGVYNQMREQFGDERAAESATRLAMLNQIDLKLKQTAAQYKSPQVQAQAQAAFGQLEIAKQNEAQKFMQAIQTSPMVNSADELTRKIQSLPKEVQKEALEERGVMDQLNQSKAQISSTLRNADKYARLGKGGSIPGTTASKVLSQAGAQIRTILQANWKGPMSDQEASALVGPFLPAWSDDAEDVENKIKGLQDLISRNSKPTPILTGYKLRQDGNSFKTLKPNE